MDKAEEQKAILTEADRIEVTYYTDPLCCWSWAFEPQWRRFRTEFEGLLSFRYIMGGLLKDWKSFKDPMNSVNRPSQMGPVWMEAKHLSGMPIRDDIWLHDAPTSSYPSCIAVKTASLQSFKAEEAYLRELRETVMIHGKDVSNVDVLMEAAENLGRKSPHIFNSAVFKTQFNNERSRQAFREDLEKVRLNQICRFPTITIHKKGGKGVLLVGYRPYQVLLEALKAVDPSFIPSSKTGHELQEIYVGTWTEREKMEVEQPI